MQTFLDRMAIASTDSHFALLMEGPRPDVWRLTAFQQGIDDDAAAEKIKLERKQRAHALREGAFTLHTFRLFRRVDEQVMLSPKGGLVVAVVTGPPAPDVEPITFAGYGMCSYLDWFNEDEGARIALGRAIKYGYPIEGPHTHSPRAADGFVFDLLDHKVGKPEHERMWSRGIVHGAPEMPSAPVLYVAREEAMAADPTKWVCRMTAEQAVTLNSLSGQSPMTQVGDVREGDTPGKLASG